MQIKKKSVRPSRRLENFHRPLSAESRICKRVLLLLRSNRTDLTILYPTSPGVANLLCITVRMRRGGLFTAHVIHIVICSPQSRQCLKGASESFRLSSGVRWIFIRDTSIYIFLTNPSFESLNCISIMSSELYPYVPTYVCRYQTTGTGVDNPCELHPQNELRFRDGM
jgi:hypothetical protein